MFARPLCQVQGGFLQAKMKDSPPDGYIEVQGL